MKSRRPSVRRSDRVPSIDIKLGCSRAGEEAVDGRSVRNSGDDDENDDGTKNRKKDLYA